MVEAAKTGDMAKVRELIRSNPGARGRTRLPDGEYPVMAALYRGHRDDRRRADRGAGSGGCVRGGRARAARTISGRRSRSRARSTAFAYDGWTPLHLAAFFGADESGDAAPGRGRRSAGGVAQLAAQHAAARRNRRRAPPIALLLIDRGADVKVPDAGKHTPLHIAAEAGLADVVEALLARGADPLAVDADDQTPLSRAAAKNRQRDRRPAERGELKPRSDRRLDEGLSTLAGTAAGSGR